MAPALRSEEGAEGGWGNTAKPRSAAQRRRTANRRTLDAKQVEHKHLVVAHAQPRRGTVHPLLRTEVPIATEQAAVDPQVALGPVRHIEVTVARLRELDRAFEEHAG